MIWIKRFSPLLVIILLWFAYTIYTQQHDAAQVAKDRKIAFLSGQIWMATARYREEPRKFDQFRDSLLRANGLDDASMKQYVKSIESDQDRQLQFSAALNRTVDSLGKIEDSLRKAASPVKSDSLAPKLVSPAEAHDSLAKIVTLKKLPPPVAGDSIRPQ